MPHAKKNLPVPHCLLHVAAGPRVQSRQPTVGRRQSRKHAESGFKCLRRALPVAKPCQRNPNIEMPQRQEMLQAHRQQSLFRSLLVSTFPQPYHRQPQVRFRTVSIDLKSALECASGVLDLFLAKIGFPNAQMQIGHERVGLFRLQQANQCGLHISFFEVNDAHQQIGPGSRLALRLGCIRI